MSRLDPVHTFRRIPPKCIEDHTILLQIGKRRLRARSTHKRCIQAEHGDIATEARCLQDACRLKPAALVLHMAVELNETVFSWAAVLLIGREARVPAYFLI